MVLLLLPLFLLASCVIPVSTSGVVSAHPHHVGNNVAAAGTSLPNYVHAARHHPVGSLDVLVFQTSIDLRVLCTFMRLIRPPRFHEPPVRVVITTPTASGSYPVILFKHGFMLANCHYTQLFQSLAASGYIVVAPQYVHGLFDIGDNDSTDEIEQTARIANWMSESLTVVLNAAVSSADVVPNLSQLVMAGHSRGGKVAFAVALGMALTEITPSFSALVTLDPVDGTESRPIYPLLVSAGCNHTRNRLSFPILILGTGYGSESGLIVPACAPTCCSHMAYFSCTSAPIMYHLVASDYGHCDFLNDFQLLESCAACKAARSKAPLRHFSAQLMVAFLESALQGEQEGMESLIENWQSASIMLEEPLVYYSPQGQVSSSSLRLGPLMDDNK